MKLRRPQYGAQYGSIMHVFVLETLIIIHTKKFNMPMAGNTIIIVLLIIYTQRRGMIVFSGD